MIREQLATIIIYIDISIKFLNLPGANDNVSMLIIVGRDYDLGHLDKK